MFREQDESVSVLAVFLKQLFKYPFGIADMHLSQILIYAIGLSMISSTKDGLAREKPDSYDMKLAHQDSLTARTLDNDTAPLPASIEAANKIDRLERQTEALRKLLGEDNLLPITSHQLWEMIFQYIMDHIEQFLKDNTLDIQIPMRYNFCMFVMPILFTDYFLVFPAFYKFLIPSKIKNILVVKNFLANLDQFLNFIKKKSEKELLITVHIKRTGSVKDDLEMIRQIPTFIVSDPIKVIRWMQDFSFKTDGYTPISMLSLK